MDFKSKFYTIFKSLNPYNYSELADHGFSNAIKYFVFIIIFSLIVAFAIFIPFLFFTGSFITDTAGHFGSFNISSSFQLKDSFTLMSDPVIRFDNSKNMTDEFLLVRPDGILYKRFIAFGEAKEIPLKSIDVAESKTARNMIAAAIIFIFPSLFFWSIIFSVFYFSIIIVITYIFLLLFTGLLRMDISMLKLLKTAIYACTIFILLELILLPFFRIFWIPLIAYWVLLIIVLFLWHDEGKRTAAHQGGSNDIFKDHSEHNPHMHSHDEVRDSYDVDDNGNLKKPSTTKHKNSGDENDGYVQL